MTLPASAIQNQDIQFAVVSAGRTWRWTTRLDVSGAVPAYEIVDILTPYGFLRDSTPLPGEVVQAMADSISTIMSNFRPIISVGPPSGITFTVDEGRGFSLPLQGTITNSGVFGSILVPSLTTSAAYLEVTPDSMAGLAHNVTGTFSAVVDSTDLLSSSSPYSETITVQDSNATNTPQTIAVTINVRPLATIATSVATLTFNVTRPLSGPFPSVAPQTFQVQNTGLVASNLDYQIARLTGLSNNWLHSFTPVSGTLAGGASGTITVSVLPVEGLMPGTYSETLRISGYSTNSFVDLLVQLVVS